MDAWVIIFLIVASVFAVCVLLYVVASIIRELCRRSREKREQKEEAKKAVVVVEEKLAEETAAVVPTVEPQAPTYEVGGMMPTYQILPPPIHFVTFHPVEPKEPLAESNYDGSNPKHRRSLALWTCLVYATVGLAAYCATAIDRTGRSKSLLRRVYDWTHR